MQDSLPAGWLAFTERELNPLDRNERFQSCYILIPLSWIYPDATSLSFCRFLACFFAQSGGVWPAFTASFYSLVLRLFGTGTIVASTIWPPRAI